MSNTAYVTYNVTTTDTVSYPPTDGRLNLIPYSDNFNLLNSFYWQSNVLVGEATSTTSGSEFQVTLLAGNPFDFGSIYTRQQTGFLPGSVSCQLATLGNADTTSSGTFLGLQVMPASVNGNGMPFQAFDPNAPDPTTPAHLRIACDQGNLVCTRNHTDVVASVTYDPVNHKYVQISNAMVSGTETASFSTSPDGVTWTQIASIPTIVDLGSSLALANVCLLAYATAAQSSSQTFGFTDYVYSGIPASSPLVVASASVTILDSSNNFVAATGSGLPAQINAVVNSGDSTKIIRQNLVSAIRMAAGDPSLYVAFR